MPFVGDSVALLHRFYHTKRPFLLLALAQVVDLFVTSRLEVHLVDVESPVGRARRLCKVRRPEVEGFDLAREPREQRIPRRAL